MKFWTSSAKTLFRLLKLITDLLEIVRLDQRPGASEPKKKSTSPHLSAAPSIPCDIWPRKNISCSTTSAQHPPSSSPVDSTAIEKVVLNLLTNSVKFTPEGGALTVDLQREDQDAVLTFQDTGIGIPAKDLPHIFDRFRQVDGSSTRKFQGVGIGLALARELVQEHGGTLTASSEERQQRSSSGFPSKTRPARLSLRRVDQPDPVAQLYREADRLIVNPHPPLDWDELSGVSGNGSKTILVIEDEPDLRKFVVSLMAEKCIRIRQERRWQAWP